MAVGLILSSRKRGMVEIELSILARQCLKRRIGDMKMLEREVSALVEKRNAQEATVQWRFTKNDARIKLERLYPIHKNLCRSIYNRV